MSICGRSSTNYLKRDLHNSHRKRITQTGNTYCRLSFENILKRSLKNLKIIHTVSFGDEWLLLCYIICLVRFDKVEEDACEFVIILHVQINIHCCLLKTGGGGHNNNSIVMCPLPGNKYKKRGNIYSRFSSNSEADASESLENIEEMFLRCHVDIDFISIYNIQSHTSVLPVAKGLPLPLQQAQYFRN